MVDGAAVVWLSEGPSSQRQESPSEAATRALEAWASARGVTLRSTNDDGPPAEPIDWAAGEEVERDLGLARDALAGLDFDAAERQLARAEALLRDHPELPQAGWLRAEVERAWSSRWLREGDEAGARRAWQRATALDGGRAPGLGEKAYEPLPLVDAAIHLSGGGALRLDGASVASGVAKRGEGVHALAIVRADGATTWAGWVSIAQGAEIRVSAPEAPDCSREDVSRAHLDGEVVRAAGVRCARWVAAVAEPDGAVRVATCAAGSCGGLALWRALAGGHPAGPIPGNESPRAQWPAWATWTLVGIGVAGATIGIIAAAGAFKSAPTDTRFVNGGLQIRSF